MAEKRRGENLLRLQLPLSHSSHYSFAAGDSVLLRYLGYVPASHRLLPQFLAYLLDHRGFRAAAADFRSLARRRASWKRFADWRRKSSDADSLRHSFCRWRVHRPVHSFDVDFTFIWRFSGGFGDSSRRFCALDEGSYVCRAAPDGSGRGIQDVSWLGGWRPPEPCLTATANPASVRKVSPVRPGFGRGAGLGAEILGRPLRRRYQSRQLGFCLLTYVLFRIFFQQLQWWRVRFSLRQFVDGRGFVFLRGSRFRWRRGRRRIRRWWRRR